MYSSQFSVPAVSYQHEYESDPLDRQQSDLLQDGVEHEANDWNINEGNDNFRVRSPTLLAGLHPSGILCRVRCAHAKAILCVQLHGSVPRFLCR
jgi:hypothetical protein